MVSFFLGASGGAGVPSPASTASTSSSSLLSGSPSSPASSFSTMLMPISLIADMTSRSEEHTSELQSLMRISYAVFCLKKKNNKTSSATKYITLSNKYLHLSDTRFNYSQLTID